MLKCNVSTSASIYTSACIYKIYQNMPSIYMRITVVAVNHVSPGMSLVVHAKRLSRAPWPPSWGNGA